MILLSRVALCAVVVMAAKSVHATVTDAVYNPVQPHAQIQRMEVVISYDGQIVFGPDGKVSKIWQL